MRKIVLDTNCLLMSLPRISPYRKIWDDFLKGKLTLCVTNEIIEEYLEIIEQKTNANIASNVVSVILSQKNVEFVDCAFTAGASCIVSNDAHFKILKEVKFPRIYVVNIKDFVELLLRNQGNDHLN